MSTITSTKVFVVVGFARSRQTWHERFLFLVVCSGLVSGLSIFRFVLLTNELTGEPNPPCVYPVFQGGVEAILDAEPAVRNYLLTVHQ